MPPFSPFVDLDQLTLFEAFDSLASNDIGSFMTYPFPPLFYEMGGELITPIIVSTVACFTALPHSDPPPQLLIVVVLVIDGIPWCKSA